MIFGRRGDLAIGIPRDAFRPSPIFLGIIALFGVSGWMTWTRFGAIKLDVFLFVISGWLVSLCLHEYAHALTAFRAGDVDVARKGYLTLNPIRYAHPILSIVLPLLFVVFGGFGLPGGAVWVDHSYIRGRLKDSLISLAGPALNVLFTLVLVLPFAFGAGGTHGEFWSAVALLGFLQLTASVLNLLPVPGLDGGNAVRPWLSYDWRRGFDAVAPYGMFLFIALLWNRTINDWFFSLVFWIGDAIGLPREMWVVGFHYLQFWRPG